MSDWDDGMVDRGSYEDRLDEIKELRAEIERLRADRNRIIEECARVAEKLSTPVGGQIIAAALRTLRS